MSEELLAPAISFSEEEASVPIVKDAGSQRRSGRLGQDKNKLPPAGNGILMPWLSCL